MMEVLNAAGVIGLLFLGYGVLDGYRKGFVKKGVSFAIMVLTMVVVYIAAPYVAEFFQHILPSTFTLENILNTDSELYRLLVLSGLGDDAENFMYVLAARVLSVVVTYVIVRLLLRMLLLSLEILTKVPGLSFLNRIFGAIFGLLQQLLILWLFLLIVAIFSTSSWGSFLHTQIQGCAYLSYLYENNLLLLIIILLLLGV
ncbi:MAG: CvpA family protein [Lachnospiraceae bacterium]|nr:CvpA family protein [Lachnospiraceae bacterium]